MLFLTARDSLEDKIAGLTIGGDDYVTKPFALAEIDRPGPRHPAPDGLRARGRRHPALRRPRDGRERPRGAPRPGTLIQLTATEFNLLRFFLLQPRHVLSKSQILDHVWHYDFGGDGNVVETYVSYLRKKFERHGPPLIHTIRLVGYTLREPEPTAGSN